jgi:vanillate O-demethylase ferredoxin subunit
MSTLSVCVQRRTDEAEGICSFELVAEDGTPLPPFTAGAHIDVHVSPGLVRQYSLCNDPAERNRYKIAVLREPQSRGGSAGMHVQVQEGQRLTIGTPRNHFSLVSARRSLLLAGGIGITPILAMARTLHAQGDSFEMHYCGRSAARMAFRDELAAAPFAHAVYVHTDDGAADQRLDVAQLLASPEAGTHLYVCGPAGFMDHVLATARACGWLEEQLHREYFAAAPVDTSGEGSFEVQLARTGTSCQVPADKTVLEVLLAHGVDLPFSCESGVCGTCLTSVLEGTPDHRDSYLTKVERAAGTQFLPCCSRSKTSVLVLDL